MMIFDYDELLLELSKINDTINRNLNTPFDLTLRFDKDKEILREQWIDRKERVYYEMRTQLNGLLDRATSRRCALVNLREEELQKHTRAPQHDRMIKLFDELIVKIEKTIQFNEKLLEELV